MLAISHYKTLQHKKFVTKKKKKGNEYEKSKNKFVEVTTLMCRIPTIIRTLTSLGIPTTVQLADKTKMGFNSI